MTLLKVIVPVESLRIRLIIESLNILAMLFLVSILLSLMNCCVFVYNYLIRNSELLLVCLFFWRGVWLGEVISFPWNALELSTIITWRLLNKFYFYYSKFLGLYSFFRAKFFWELKLKKEPTIWCYSSEIWTSRYTIICSNSFTH